MCCCNIIMNGAPDDILMMLKIHGYFLGNIFSCVVGQCSQWKMQIDALLVEKLCEMDVEINLVGEESLKYMLETSKGLDSLQKLLAHPNEKVSNQSERIYHRYFNKG